MEQGALQWEAFGDFQHSNVHKQVAISFRTPKYKSQEVTESIKVCNLLLIWFRLDIDQIFLGFQCFIQLKKPSDGSTSEALPFEYLPLDSGRRSIYAMRKGLRHKNNFAQLEKILSMDLTHTNGDGTIVADNSNSFISAQTITNGTKSPVTVQNVSDVEMIDSAEKTAEWLKQAEFAPLDEDMEKPIVAQEENRQINPTMTAQSSFDDQKTVTARSDFSNPDEDRTLNELLEQVAELDEIYSGYQLKRIGEPNASRLIRIEKSSFEDTFDDTATYTSLQRAFKNPVQITEREPSVSGDAGAYDIVEPIINPMAPFIDISPVMRELSRLSEEEKLPPLPPKRSRRLTADNIDFRALNDLDSNSLNASPERPLSQIIIKRTPDQMLNPRSPVQSDCGSTQSSPQKKQGFFSRIFRRKSKSDINSNCTTEAKNTPETSREPSIQNFDVADRTRLSSRSFRSPLNTAKRGKPVGRSVSSVSGKRPNLTADIVHIPLKGGSSDSLPMRSGSGNIGPNQYGSQVTLSNQLDRKTVSALQLADLPIQDGNMELIAIADRQSLKNLCEGAYGVRLDDDVDLTEAEHFALYTSVAPYATASEFDETSAFYAAVDSGEILTNEEIAKRLASGGKMD